MTIIDDKIEIIGKLLDVYKNLPEQSWLSQEDIDWIMVYIQNDLIEGKIDQYIDILVLTLEKIWLKMKTANNAIQRIALEWLETNDIDNNQEDINTLFY